MIIIYALGVRTYTLTGHFWPGRPFCCEVYGQDALLAGSVGIDLMATLNSDIDPGGMTSNG